MAIRFEDIHPGDAIPPAVHRPSALQLFRFSAVTWNAHRIHYEPAYAQSEGYPGVLVQAHLHGALLARLLRDWSRPDGTLRELEWSNRRYAIAGERLTCRGVVKRCWVEDGQGLVECEIEETNEQGEVTVPGRAIVAFPLAPDAREGR